MTRKDEGNKSPVIRDSCLKVGVQDFQKATTATPAKSERTMDATTPMFMLKRMGRAAELAALEEAAAAAEPELAGAVADDAAEEICVPLMVVPKPEGVDSVTRVVALDSVTLVLVVAATLCVEAEAAVVAVVVPVTAAPIIKGADSVRTC